MILTKLRLLLLLPSLSWAQPVSDEVPCLPTRVSCNDDYEYRCADSFDANGCELNHICKVKAAGCPEVCPEPYDSATQLSCPTTNDKGCDTYKIVSLVEHTDCSSVTGGDASNNCPPPLASCNDYEYKCTNGFDANGCELNHVCKMKTEACPDVCPEPYDSATQLSCQTTDEKGCDAYKIVNMTDDTACPVPSQCGHTSCNDDEFGCHVVSECAEQQYVCLKVEYGRDGRECPKLCHQQLEEEGKFVCSWKDANGCPVAVSDASECPEDCGRTSCFPEEYGCPRESSCADQQYDCIMKGTGLDGTLCNGYCDLPDVAADEQLCPSQDANMCPKEPTKVKAGKPCPGECNSLDQTCEQGLAACPYKSNCDQQQYYCHPVEAGGCALQCPLMPEEGKVICPQTYDSSGCPEAQVAAIAAADCPGAIVRDEFFMMD